MTKDVVGPDDEVAGILAFLDDGASSALVLEGEAGLGKTTLWRAGVEAARDRGQTVLTWNPSGSETQFSLSAVRDLLDDCFDELADELPEPQRRVLGVALLRAEPEDPPPQPSAIAASFLNALRRLADRGPVLVAVDDVQWLDGSSAGVLEFAAHRLRGDPIRLLLSARTEGEPRVPLGQDRTFVRGDLRRIEVGRLSLGRPCVVSTRLRAGTRCSPSSSFVRCSGADIAVGPTGDLYVIAQNAGIVHFAEDRSKPATAAVSGKSTVKKGKATVKYSATGIACPAQVDAMASLNAKASPARRASRSPLGRGP
jgi:hypothetical protein